MARAPDIISHRCDKPMRRSKEQGYIRAGVHWKCTSKCNECICGLIQQEDGTWKHVRISK